MRCQDCGKSQGHFFDVVDGRRVIRLCQMCKAQREWHQAPDGIPLHPPIKLGWWQKLKKFLGLK